MKKSSQGSHTFSVNVFGTIGYIGIIGTWVFLIVAAIVFVKGDTLIDSASQLPILSVYEAASPIASSAPTNGIERDVIRFLLIALLCVATWLFCHVAGKAVSRVIKRLIRHAHHRVTLRSLEYAKLSIAAVGLILLAGFLLIFPDDLAFGRFALALLGFMSGIIAAGGIWVQQVLVRRYKVPVNDVI